MRSLRVDNEPLDRCFAQIGECGGVDGGVPHDDVKPSATGNEVTPLVDTDAVPLASPDNFALVELSTRPTVFVP